MLTLESKIEAILFFKNEPVTKKKLADILKVSKEEIEGAIPALREQMSGRGIVLQEREDELALGTAPEMGKLVEDLQKEELNKDLSRASLETLSIILYKNGATRSEIDYIRGVNSSFILRALSVRGLVEKITDPKDQRRFLYQPTFDLLSFMGVKNISELPEYAVIEKEISGAAESLAEKAKESE